MTDLPNEIKSLKADSRGRINIGTKYADEEVRVAVVEVIDSATHICSACGEVFSGEHDCPESPN